MKAFDKSPFKKQSDCKIFEVIKYDSDLLLKMCRQKMLKEKQNLFSLQNENLKLAIEYCKKGQHPYADLLFEIGDYLGLTDRELFSMTEQKFYPKYLKEIKIDDEIFKIGDLLKFDITMDAENKKRFTFSVVANLGFVKEYVYKHGVRRYVELHGEDYDLEDIIVSKV